MTLYGRWQVIGEYQTGRFTKRPMKPKTVQNVEMRACAEEASMASMMVELLFEISKAFNGQLLSAVDNKTIF